MTIEQDIKVIRKMLAYTDLNVRANLNADMVDACEDAIEIMRKFQEIQEITNKWKEEVHSGVSCSYDRMEDIWEVLDDKS